MKNLLQPSLTDYGGLGFQLSYLALLTYRIE